MLVQVGMGAERAENATDTPWNDGILTVTVASKQVGSALITTGVWGQPLLLAYSMGYPRASVALFFSPAGFQARFFLLFFIAFMYFYLFIFILFEREKEREREWFSICWIVFQMPTKARAGLGWVQELGTPSGSTMWVAEAKLLGPSPAASKICISGELESGIEGKNRSQSNAMWHLNILTTRPNTCSSIALFIKNFKSKLVYNVQWMKTQGGRTL